MSSKAKITKVVAKPLIYSTCIQNSLLSLLPFRRYDCGRKNWTRSCKETARRAML